MPEFRGTVRCVRVSEGSGFTTLENASGGTETFILWFAPGGGSGIPPDLTAFTRVAHSMWLSILREALASNLAVTIVHPSSSSVVNAVQLG